MITSSPDELTQAVLAELARIQAPRLRQIMTAAVQHLHAFAREVQLTEAEFQQACGLIAQLGQLTTPSHNEVVMTAGSLGLSSLVCLMNNGDAGRQPTTANLMGPFWRQDAPLMAPGASIVRSATPGLPIFVQAWVADRQGRPVAGAMVDVWHSSGEGFYENQDPAQADMNLRGRFVSDAHGLVHFRSVKPAGYPIPVSGPVGALLRAAGRHNLRPAHIHFLIDKPGYKTQFSQVYASDDPNLDTDVQFGVTCALVGQMLRHDDQPAPAPDVSGPWYSLDHHFVIEPGESRLPKPPISGKAEGDRPLLAVLGRRA